LLFAMTQLDLDNMSDEEEIVNRTEGSPPRLDRRRMPLPNGVEHPQDHMISQMSSPSLETTNDSSTVGGAQISPPVARQNIMMNPSPSMAARQPPNDMNAQILRNLNAEFQKIPAALLGSIKQEIGLVDKDTNSFSPVDKQRAIHTWYSRRECQHCNLDADEFDAGFLSSDDLNFERDFAQWFNPDWT